MVERISKSLVRNGLKNGTIRTEINGDGELLAYIGDYWFYAGTGPDTEYKNLPEEAIINLIHGAINGEPINSNNKGQATECLYYKAILEESEGKTS